MAQETIIKLIGMLEHVRKRPTMYLGTPSEKAVKLFAEGVRCAYGAFGLPLTLDIRRQATNERGWGFPSNGPAGEMRERGYTEKQVVDELLMIEIRTLQILADCHWTDERRFMFALSKPPFTFQEYLERERFANFKSAYLSGEICAMSGAGESHNLIVTNVIRELSLQLKGRPCRTYPRDMKVETGPASLFTYPDVSVVCEEPLFPDGHNDMVLNRTLIVEVLSPSMEDYERDAKCAHYRRLSSLTDYLLISSTTCRGEYYVRQPDDQWLPSETTGAEETSVLATIGCRLEMAEVYDRVEFTPRIFALEKDNLA